MLDEDHGRAVVGQRAQQGREAAGLLGVLPGRGLVEEQEPGLDGEGAADLDQAAGAGGELVGRTVGDLGQVEPGEELGDGALGPPALGA